MMKRLGSSKLLAIALTLPVLVTGCVTPGEDDPNAATKHGAAGGALLGLTMGALTGSGELAAKGAIAGAVAGGVAGASQDIANNRDNIRHDSRNDAIGNVGSSQTSHQQTAQNWPQLDNFVGEWNVTIRNFDDNLVKADPIQATGALAKTTQADIKLSNDQGLDLTTQFSYTQEQGYQLNMVNNQTDVVVAFVGEYQQQANRYQFYPTNLSDVIYQGIPSEDIRLELGFAGGKVWMVDTYAFIDGQERKLQSYRFTKQG